MFVAVKKVWGHQAVKWLAPGHRIKQQDSDSHQISQLQAPLHFNKTLHFHQKPLTKWSNSLRCYEFFTDIFYVGGDVVQLLNRVWLTVMPWTAAHQASLSSTSSQSLLKLMSIESVMTSNHLILCRPLLLQPLTFPSIRVFSNESVLLIRWSKYKVSASASVLPMNIQDWFPLGLTGWISLQSKGLSRVFSTHK